MEKNPDGQIGFRPMKLTDLPQIEELENLSFTIPWSRQAFYNELMFNRFAHYTVVTVNERVAGYCGFWLILDEAHISNIAVHPDYRGRGIGEALFDQVIQKAKDLGATKMTLEVRVSNVVAQSLYKKKGFVETGIRKGYYTDNQEDAIVMWVNLDDVKSKNLNTGN